MNPSYEWPIGVRLVDVAQPLSPLEGLARYSRVRVFVASGDVLVGAVDVWNRGADSISVDRLREEIAARLGTDLMKLEWRGALLTSAPAAGASSAGSAAPGPPTPPLTVSIVVATCDRADDLRRCLRSLVEQRTRHPVEIVVVDNRPSSGAASAVVREFDAIRVVTERRPGLSYARNAGIAQAKGTIVVTTDDDVVAPPEWIERLLAPFERDDVMCVTGNVLPLELETQAQCRFEAYGGLGKGFDRIEADAAWFRGRRTAVPTWTIGATANAAFRRSIFSRPDIGPMDEALGAGTPTGCSEDTYLFYRILRAGFTIVYEPSAYVWHRHRASMQTLRSQVYAYSKGHVAYHLLTLARERDRRALWRLGYSLPRTYAQRAVLRALGRSDYPVSLIALEVLGSLAGPLALWRSIRRVRRLGPSARPATERTDAVSLESQAT